MARQTTKERLQAVHTRSVRAFDSSYMPQTDVRLHCLQARRFAYVPGAQWEGNLEQQFANRPRFEINKVLDSLMRIFSEYRNNRVTVDFRTKDDKANDKTADNLNGLFRSDEQESNAEEAYDNAFDEGTAGGFGAWRLKAKYENENDEDDEHQRICIEPIFDADMSVFYDADAKRQDKADATKCWLIYTMSPHDFEEAWDRPPASFDRTNKMTRFDWYTPDVVYVAEYYEVEFKKTKIHFFRQNVSDEVLKVSADELTPEYELELEALGYTESRQKTITRRRVHKYIIDGMEVLEDCGYIAGEYIPVIPYYGKRMFIDNKERMFGHTLPMMDAQRIYNMEISALAEQASVFGESIPIFTPEQMAGNEHHWADKNIKRPPYLLINGTDDAQGNPMPAAPQAYTQPPVIPPALQGLIQLVQSDIMELAGNQQQGDELQPNVSGKAVELVQSRLDMKSFIYQDNFKKAMRQSGVVWLSMAKDLYDEEGRKMRTIGKDDAEGQTIIKQPGIDKYGQAFVENDLSVGMYDVAVDVGPGFASKRDKAVRGLLGILQYIEDPSMKAAVVGMILQNMEGEGLDDLRAFARQGLVKAGVIPPTDEEKAELAQEAEATPPDAQQEFLMASAKKELARIPVYETEAQKNIALAQKAQADATKTEVDAAVSLSGIQGQIAQLMAAVQAIAAQQPATPVPPQAIAETQQPPPPDAL